MGFLIALWGAAAGAQAPAAPSPGAEDPWALLSAVRRELAAAGPTAADFTQTYLPAGFSSGEQEKGRLSLALPDCLRWDYAAPYPKSFLLCGGVVHYWNPEDETGRTYKVDSREEPGLDLLLLGTEELKARYRASLAAGEGGAQGEREIHLEPVEGRAGAGIRDATLTVDAAGKHLARIEYHDAEGNLTRFEISGYQPLAGRDLFRPPDGVTWVEGKQ